MREFLSLNGEDGVVYCAPSAVAVVAAFGSGSSKVYMLGGAHVTVRMKPAEVISLLSAKLGERVTVEP